MISVLTVNYRSADQVAGLAESLRRHAGGLPVELVITNNSPADSLHHLGGPPPAVIHREASNVGYAAGINLAFQASHGETLMIANPDVRVTEGALPRAVAYLASHSEAGIVLPLLRYPSGEVQPSVRRFYTWPVAVYARCPLRALGYRPAFFRRYLCEDIQHSRPTPVDWGLGGAMFLRRSDCDDGGIFDERFFMYFEDVDLCYRTWQRGRLVMYCPDIECVHEHRRSSRNPFSLHGWRHFRSLLRFIRKHGGLPPRPSQQTPHD